MIADVAYKIAPKLSRGEYTIRLCKEFTIDVAHRIWNQELPSNMECKCVQIHGHTSKIVVTLEGPYNPETGMIIDFNILKNIINDIKNQLDHKLLVDVNDPLYEELKKIPGAVILPFVPTAENMAVLIKEYFQVKLPNINVVSVSYYETSTAYAEVV